MPGAERGKWLKTGGEIKTDDGHSALGVAVLRPPSLNRTYETRQPRCLQRFRRRVVTYPLCNMRTSARPSLQPTPEGFCESSGSIVVIGTNEQGLVRRRHRLGFRSAIVYHALSKHRKTWFNFQLLEMPLLCVCRLVSRPRSEHCVCRLSGLCTSWSRPRLYQRGWHGWVFVHPYGSRWSHMQRRRRPY